MKRIFSLFLLLTFAVVMKAQQAAMPTIIVFPADSWMNDHGFMKTFNNQGETEYIPKYNEAFVNTREMGSVIQSIQKVFEERKFEHEDLQSILKDMKRERAEELANAADGYEAEKGAMDELMQQARPDIRVDVDYAVQMVGPRKNISYTIKAVDAYTSEQVSSVEGTISMTMDPTDLALRKAVAGNCDDLCDRIIEYYKDLRDNGRKIVVVFRSAPSAGINFIKDEIGDDGDTYDEFLYSWVKKHAVNRACKIGRKTADTVEFKAVRIPFFDESGEPIEAEEWAKGVRKAFKAETGFKVSKGQGNRLGRVNFLVE